MSSENTAQIIGKVKWFNQFKGYGFVEIKDIAEDIFLHFSVIEQSNIKDLGKDDVILCSVQKSGKGYQITKIERILAHNKFALDQEKERVSAIMKWFNPTKGFGFAQMETGEDVFIHSSLLKKLNISGIEPNQKVELVIHHTNLGHEALELSIVDSND